MVLTSIIDEDVTVKNSEEIGLRFLIFGMFTLKYFISYFSGPERIL